MVICAMVSCTLQHQDIRGDGERFGAHVVYFWKDCNNGSFLDDMVLEVIMSRGHYQVVWCTENVNYVHGTEGNNDILVVCTVPQ